jgi:hypothetical protein
VQVGLLGAISPFKNFLDRPRIGALSAAASEMRIDEK